MLLQVPKWVVRLYFRERFDHLGKDRRMIYPFFIG